MSLAQKIYSTVPKSNHLHLVEENGEPDYAKILKFLRFDKSDFSKATGVPVSSIRYDRLPKELHERFLEIAAVCELVADHFGGDIGKTAQWFSLPNPLLGEISPRDMIRMGRFKKLMKIIYDARQGS